jgi:uncharacterized protein YciI
MFAVRIASTDPAKLKERQTHLEAHKRYLRESPLRILLSGPLAGRPGQPAALVVAQVEDLLEMETFSSADPFVLHGVYATVQILAWNVSLSRVTGLAQDLPNP